jgi:ribosomal protein S27AE
VTEPDHVRGVCDIADCEEVASRAFRDDEAEMYVEVCARHQSSFDGFDSDYERVEHDSPHRSPREVERHDCGGDLHVYEVEDGIHRVCVRCGYSVLMRDTGEKSMTVRSATGERKRD